LHPRKIGIRQRYYLWLLYALQTKKAFCFSGSEFIAIATQEYFDKKGIFHVTKRGNNKASFAEFGIGLVKRRVLIAARTLRDDDWPALLKDCVDDLNQTRNPAIGGLKPSSVNSSLDDVKVDAAKEKAGISPHEVHWQDWAKNQKAYTDKKSKDLQVNDWVFASLGKGTMYSSYDFQVSCHTLVALSSL
jgi:hypothetical protein